MELALRTDLRVARTHQQRSVQESIPGQARANRQRAAENCEEFPRYDLLARVVLAEKAGDAFLVC